MQSDCGLSSCWLGFGMEVASITFLSIVLKRFKKEDEKEESSERARTSKAGLGDFSLLVGW